MNKLNFGCGNGKLSGFINCDVDPEVKPDVLLDMTEVPYPFEENSASLIVCAHTIEHIEKRFHFAVLLEFARILQKDGLLILAYPEFTECAKNWLANKGGQREFWESTILGRGTTVHDRHISLMETIELSESLIEVGFEQIHVSKETNQDFNTIVRAKKGTPLQTYEQALAGQFFATMKG